MQILHIAFLGQLALTEHIVDVFRANRAFTAKQLFQELNGRKLELNWRSSRVPHGPLIHKEP